MKIIRVKFKKLPMFVRYWNNKEDCMAFFHRPWIKLTSDWYKQYVSVLSADYYKYNCKLKDIL